MEAVRRDNKDLPTELLTGIFLLQAPENETPRTAIVPMANGYAVVQLEQVVDGVVPDDDPAKVQNYRRRIANASANSEAMGFLRMLRKHAQIEVFEDRL